MATDTAAVTVDSQSGRPVYNLSKALHRRLIWTLSGNFLFLLALYNAVISVFLPNTVQKITDASPGGGDKVVALATIMTISSFLTIFAQPLAGAFSDRCRSRFGLRAPFILVGSFIGGAAQTGGGTLGIIFGGWIANRNLPLGYVIFGVGIFLVCLVFVLLNPEPSTKGMQVEPFSWRTFFKQFWVSPRKHPDFGWAFGGRFLMYLGYQGVVAYQLYILRDYIGQSESASNVTIGVMSTIQLVTLILSSVVSGYLSDKFQARKPFVFFATIVMAVSYLVPLFWRTESGMLVMAAVLGLGYGAYMSIDMALMTQVLPNDGENAGKDMGVLTIATNLPQMLTQPIVAVLLTISSGSYVILFVWAIVLVFVSSLLVLPIKSVK
jgi:Na+/melibiose symporter-like transporter